MTTKIVYSGCIHLPDGKPVSRSFHPYRVVRINEEQAMLFCALCWDRVKSEAVEDVVVDAVKKSSDEWVRLHLERSK